jgi:hypothetical protein
MGQFGMQPRERADLGFELGTFAPEFLRALGIIPEFRLLQLALDFDQAMLLGVEVKDTPVRPGSGRGGRAIFAATDSDLAWRSLCGVA